VNKLYIVSSLRSRGRTIQELIETVWEMQKDSKGIMKVLEKNPTLTTDQFLSIINPYLMDMLRRLWRFEE